MITWLQNFFLKHNKWLFGSLLVVIIVTFVLTIGPQSFFGSSGPQQREALNFYGYDLTSEADQRQMVMTAELSSIFHPELQVPRNQLMDYAYLRVTALGMANQLGIPNPEEESLKAYIETFRLFQDPTAGGFSAETYQQMLDALQANGRYSRDLIGRVMREDYRISRVREALGGPAFVLPFEARQEFIDQESSYEVTLFRFPFSEFLPEISPSEEDLRAFFEENPSAYEVPEQISVTAVQFRGAAYLDEVEDPGEEALMAYFEENKDRYQRRADAAAEEGEEAAEVTLDGVRESVVSDWKRNRSREVAGKKSEQFSVRLWQDGIARGSEAFDALLEEFEAELQPIPAYSRGNPPALADVPRQLLDSVWIYSSNPNRYFSDMARTGSGAAILIFNELIPSRMPTFAEVRSTVRADYTDSERRRLFAEKGEELRESLEEALAADDAVAADVAESLGLRAEKLETFTGNNLPSQLRRGQIWNQVRYLGEGDVSPMIILENTGTLAYMEERETVDIDDASEAFQTFLDDRKAMLEQAMGWARLREITDTSLASIIGEQP
jgi:peptidyl-prolyl cis-trans isomerase D